MAFSSSVDGPTEPALLQELRLDGAVETYLGILVTVVVVCANMHVLSLLYLASKLHTRSFTPVKHLGSGPIMRCGTVERQIRIELSFFEYYDFMELLFCKHVDINIL